MHVQKDKLKLDADLNGSWPKTSVLVNVQVPS